MADENHDEDPELRFVAEVEDAPTKALKAGFLAGPAKKVRPGSWAC